MRRSALRSPEEQGEIHSWRSWLARLLYPPLRKPHISAAWLRRFLAGECDGAVYDVEEMYPLYAERTQKEDL